LCVIYLERPKDGDINFVFFVGARKGKQICKKPKTGNGGMQCNVALRWGTALMQALSSMLHQRTGPTKKICF
jgi:hypothetical protein